MNRAMGGCMALALLACAGLRGTAADSQSAQEQYRLARRLAAENAGGADEALRRVLELDPQGPLADDALVERARLGGVGIRPESLGGISAEQLREIVPWLDRAASMPGADRGLEARYLLALARLEPVAGHDGGAARRELLAVAAADPASSWAARARYAVGWLDLARGGGLPAREAWSRVVLDAPRSDAAAWAALGLARIDLAEGQPGSASMWAQRALDSGEPRWLDAVSVRAAALRDLRREYDASLGWPSWSARPLCTVGRSVSALARDGNGGLYAASEREGSIRRCDPEGRMVDRWSLEDTTALAFDPWGRLLAAAGEGIFVVEPGSTRPLGVLGRFASASALSPTATGKIYVLDRKGDRIGVLEPGAKAPAPLREERGTRFAALTEVRGRLVGAAQREGRLLEIAASGLETPLASLPVDGIDSVCVDAASRFVVLEARRGRIVLSTDDGTVVDRLDLKAKGLEKPTRVVCGSDGTLDVYDASTGQVWRIGE